MKTFKQKRAELEAAKEGIYKEIDAIKSKYEEQLKAIDEDLEALDRAELLLADDVEDSVTEKASSNGKHFAIKGSMSIRQAIRKTLKESAHPLHLDELMEALPKLGVHSDRGTVRARLTRGVQKKEYERVAEATYALSEN